MNYYMDMEFHEDGRIIDLISIGIVAEDGREFYGVSSNFDPVKCNDWVKENVLPHLYSVSSTGADMLGFPRATLRAAIEGFIGADQAPVFWGYYCDYDWVLFCQLWGRMIDKPPHFPFNMMDVEQLRIDLGVATPLKMSVPQVSTEHNALCDARWIRDAHKHLEMKKNRFV